MIKKLEWIKNGKVEYSTEIETKHKKLNNLLVKDMWDSEDADTMESLKISNINTYIIFINKWLENGGTIELDGVEI